MVTARPSAEQLRHNKYYVVTESITSSRKQKSNLTYLNDRELACILRLTKNLATGITAFKNKRLPINIISVLTSPVLRPGRLRRTKYLITFRELTDHTV